MKFIECREIPIEKIIPCPLIIDRDDIGDVEELTGEIFVSILVRESKIQPGYYERITGFRRMQKAIRDNKTTIRCDIYELSDEEALLNHTKENLQRKSLTIFEEGKDYQNLLERLEKFRGTKVTQEQLAKILSGKRKKISQETICNAIRSLKLPIQAQNYLALNNDGHKHIRKIILLLQIDNKDLQIELARGFAESPCTDFEAEERIREMKKNLTTHKRWHHTCFVNGKVCIIPPEVIHIDKAVEEQPLLTEPHCQEIAELIHRIEKLQFQHAVYCPICPVKNFCGKAVPLHTELEKKKRIKDYCLSSFPAFFNYEKM